MSDNITVVGKVLEIEIDVQVKGNNNSYQGWRLTYKNSQGDAKTIAKHMNSLKYNQPLNNGLKELSVGDEFTMELVKKDGFWNPTSISKGATKVEQQPTKTFSKPQASSGGSNWPTAEERAKTQVHIIRQNSVTNAVSFMNAIGNKKATPADVVQVAKEFEAFIHGEKFDDGSIESLQSDDLGID